MQYEVQQTIKNNWDVVKQARNKVEEASKKTNTSMCVITIMNGVVHYEGSRQLCLMVQQSHEVDALINAYIFDNYDSNDSSSEDDDQGPELMEKNIYQHLKMFSL